MKHVLFIDDSPILLRTVKSFVPEGYKVSIAVNYTQALRVVDQSMPDLIFLDYEMPEMSGEEMLAKFRQRDDMKELPVLFLTAHTEAEYIDAVAYLNPAGFVPKPPTATNIAQAITEHVG